MFRLHAVQAQFGDCLILEFGTDVKPRYLLIDGGPSHNFDDDLAAALTEIVTTKKLELAILSHIDADHIVGLLDLFAALEEDDTNDVDRRVAVAGLWHNSFQKTIDPDGTISQRMQAMAAAAAAASVAMPLSMDALFGVKEGNRLRILAKKLKVPVNTGFANDLILLETAPAPVKLGSMTLRVIGPNQTNLNALHREWIKWLEKLEKQMVTDPATMANSDKSVPNLSSIILLAQQGGKSILLTGDARSDHIVSGLEAVGLLEKRKFHVNVLKVGHHGSARNHTAKFFKAITADTYVISANGKYDNPDYDTLTWIVDAAKGANRNIEIVVTNATDSTEKLKSNYKPADFGYTLTVKPNENHSIPITLS